MRKVVVFVNGRAGAGKDTVIGIMCGVLGAFGWRTDAYSSIDPVREVLRGAGIEVTGKTEKDRALLAEMGFSLEKHSSYRSNRVCKVFETFAESMYKPSLMFVAIREHDLMLKMKQRLMSQGVDVVTLFVDRDVAPIISNDADANVPDKSLYEYVVSNNGTLADLAVSAAAVAGQMVKLGQHQ